MTSLFSLLPLCFVLFAMSAGGAAASVPVRLDLDGWRRDVAAVRILVENDAPAAQKQALHLLAEIPDAALSYDRVRALNLLARAEAYLALVEQSNSHAREAAELAQQYGDRTSEAEALLVEVLNTINQADIDAMVTATTRAVELLEAGDRPDLLAEALLHASMMYWRLGQADNAVGMVLRAREMADSSADASTLSHTYYAIAMWYQLTGRPPEAREWFVKAREQARAARSALLEGHALVGMASVNIGLGDYAAAERQTQEAVALFRAVGAPFSLASGVYALEAYLHQRQGRHGEAVRVLNQAADIYRQYPNAIGLWYTLQARTASFLALKRFAEAERDAEEAYRLAVKIGLPQHQAQSAKLKSELSAAVGDYRKAYGLAKEAEALGAKVIDDKKGSRILELVKSFEAENSRHRNDELLRRNERQAAELVQRTLQARWLWTLLIASVIMLVGSAFFQFRLRQSHRRLRAANARLDMMAFALDRVGEAVYLIDPDSWRLIDVNAEACRALGYSREELKSMTVFDIDPDAAADREEVHRVVDNIEQSGSIVFERRHRAKDGRVFPVEIFASNFEYHGKEIGLSFARDISERKLIEAELAEREREFRTLAENSPDIIVRYDRLCRRIYVNRAYLDWFGVELADVLGNTLDEGGIGEPGYAGLLRQAIVFGRMRETQMEYGHGEKAIYYAVNLVPEFDAAGEVISVLSISRDITSLKVAELSLQKSRAELRALAARSEDAREDERKHIAREMHDELGQRLTALRMDIGRLRIRFGQDNPALLEEAKAMTAAVDAAIQVVRHVVARLRPAVLDMGMASALEWLADDFAKRAGVPCEVRCLEQRCAWDDNQATALFRIVQESLTNIARYAAATRVVVSLKGNDDDWVLEICDNGRGFDAKIPRKAGAFGLMGIEERVLMLNGTLTIDTAPGQGVRLTVRFPGENKHD